MKKFKILETTLRDGSYAINFTFTSSDTSIISKALEDVGFDLIEVGHGVGLNASKCGHGEAIESDEEYMIAAESVLTKAKYGMFCIPGIARLEDVDLAAKHNMGFIRIGTNATEVESSEKFIEKAKNYGMTVMSNYMKSYALEPKELAEKVKLSQKYGADIVYIVDSSGGMFTDTLKQYYYAIRDVSDIPIGFHGHNNLGLAIANSLEAINIGIDYIDTSLQGLGRSSGNASTEILIAALLKLGYDDLGIDFLKLLEIGKKYINPLMTSNGHQPLDVISGYSDFHSSYMKYIQKYSAKHKVSPANLIMEWCKIDKVNMDEKKLDELASKIKKEDELYLGKYNFSRYIGSEQSTK